MIKLTMHEAVAIQEALEAVEIDPVFAPELCEIALEILEPAIRTEFLTKPDKLEVCDG